MAIDPSILIEADRPFVGSFTVRVHADAAPFPLPKSDETMADDKLKLALLDIILNLARTPGVGDVQTVSALAEIATIGENQIRRHRARSDAARDIG